MTTTMTSPLIPQQLGLLGEEWIAGRLLRAGARVQIGGPADLLVNGVPLEVKTARPSYWQPGYLGFQFCIRRHGRYGLRAPFLALVCWSFQTMSGQPDTFILPASQLNGQTRLTIPRARPDLYRGRFSAWLNQWSLLL